MVNIAEIKRQMLRERLEKAFGSEEIEKARSGVYADTAENRKKGRVGQKYGEEKKQKDVKLSVDEKSYVRDSINKFRRRNYGAYPDKEYKELLSDLRKKFSGKKRQPLLNYLEKLEHIAGSEGKSLMLLNIQQRLKKAEDNDIEKARHGVYADNAENRAKQRVGQEYGQAAQPQEPGEKRQPKGSEEGGGDIKSYASNASDEALKRAAADKNAKPEVREAAKNELANRNGGNDKKSEPVKKEKKEDADFTESDADRFKELNDVFNNPEKRKELDELRDSGKYNKVLDEYRVLKQKSYNHQLKASGALTTDDFKDINGISSTWICEANDSDGKMITPYIRIALDKKSDVKKFMKDVKKKFNVELTEDNFEHFARNRYSDSYYEVCVNPDTNEFADNSKTLAAISQGAEKKQAEIDKARKIVEKEKAMSAMKESITKDSVEKLFDNDEVRSHALSYFNYGDDDECSEEEKEQFQKLKKLGAKVSEYFDWREDDAADTYERKMQAKGYRLFDISTSNGYIWLLIKNNKLDKNSEIKKGLDSVSDLVKEIRN